MGKPRSSYTADRKPAPLPPPKEQAEKAWPLPAKPNDCTHADAATCFARGHWPVKPIGDVELSYVKFKHAVPMTWGDHLAEVYAGALCGGRIYVRGQLVHILRGSAETVVPVGDMMTGEVKR